MSNARPSSTSQSVASNSSTSTTDDGVTGITLKRSDDGSVTIEVSTNAASPLRNNELHFPSDTYVIKVGDTYTKGESIEKLNALLQGPVDSEVELTMYQGDQVISKKLKRYSQPQIYKDSYSYSALTNISSIPGEAQSKANYCLFAKNYEHTQNDTIAGCYYKVSTAGSKIIIPPSYEDSNPPCLADAMEFFARTGMYAEFDATAARTLQIAESDPKLFTDSDVDLLTESATILSKYGFREKAKIISERLRVLLPNLTGKEAMRNLKDQDAVRILALNASLSGQSDEAIQDYKRISLLCSFSTLPPEFLLEVLPGLVSDCMNGKYYDAAVIAQSKLASLTPNAQGWVKALQHQKYVGALCKLSEIYAQSGAQLQVQATLKQALSAYDELNAQEVVVLERIGNVCPSNIRMRLAKSYVQSNQVDKAIEQLGVAEKLTAESSLPRISTRIRQVQNSLASKNDEVVRITALNALALLIGPVGIPETAFDKDTDQLARKVHENAVNNTNVLKTTTILQQLVQEEFTKSTHTASDISRLINLTRCITTHSTLSPQTISKLAAVLDRIDRSFNDTERSLNSDRAFVKAERALLSDEGFSDSTWQELELFLSDMEKSTYPNLANHQDEQRKFARLFDLSVAYAFLEEPQKAERILKYASERYPKILERNVSPVAFEATLHSLSGNMPAAQKCIKTLLRIESEHDGWKYINYSRDLIGLTSTLAQTNHPDLSLKILNTYIVSTARGMQQAKGIFKLQRAVIEEKLGNFQESLASIEDVENKDIYGRSSNENYRFLKALLLEKTGQIDKAILAYTEVYGDAPILASAMQRAVALSRISKTLSSSTTQALFDFVQKNQTVINKNNNVDSITALLKLIDEKKSSPQSISDLSSQLADAQLQNGDTTSALRTTRNNAQLLEAEHNPGASREWASLGRMHFRCQEFAEGTECMLHALQIADSTNSFPFTMYHPGNMRADTGFDLLVNAKQYDAAASILNASIKSHYLSKTEKYICIERSLLADLYVDQDKYEEAAHECKKLIATFAESDKLCSQNYMSTYLFYSNIEKFITHKKLVLAKNLLDEATLAELKVVGPRNATFIENFQTYAKLFEALNKLSEAENYARRALELETWIGGSQNTGRISRVLLASILRAENKGIEADRVATVEQKQKTRAADYANLYNIHFHSFHMRLPDVYAPTAEEPLKKSLLEAIEISGEASKSATEAVDNLTKFYTQRGRLDEAEKLQLHELQILDEQFGKCSHPKNECYLQLSEIYLLKNKPQLASKFASLISAPYTSDLSRDRAFMTLRYARAFYGVGRKDLALKMGREVEDHLLNLKKGFEWHGIGGIGYSYTDSLNECLHFMEHIGAVSDTVALRAKLNELDANAHPKKTYRPVFK